MIPVIARAATVKLARGLSYLVFFWVVVSLLILSLGFFLKLFGASADASFVEWAYRNLERVMEPFRGIFPEHSLGESGAILDVSILFAMIVYGFVAIGFRALTDWLTVRMHRLDFELLEIKAAEERAKTEIREPIDSAAGAEAAPETFGAD